MPKMKFLLIGSEIQKCMPTYSTHCREPRWSSESGSPESGKSWKWQPSGIRSIWRCTTVNWRWVGTPHSGNQVWVTRILNISGKQRSEEHTSELQSRGHLVCRLLLDKKNTSNDKKVICNE